jgi:hypothetical protein
MRDTLQTEAVMPDGKSLIDFAILCERRAKTVESEGDREQLKLIAVKLKEMAARELASAPVG